MPGFMQPVINQSPWQIVAYDVMGPFSQSSHGNQYLFVITDCFTKRVELYPPHKLASQKIWGCLFETFMRLGFHLQLITDNATYIRSKAFADSSANVGIQYKTMTHYHP